MTLLRKDIFSIMTKYIPFLLLFLSLIFSPGCRKNKNVVPYVPVDIYINISLPAYSDLNIIGGWAYVSGGSKGLIVYRQTADIFMAYDRHCTYNADNPCGSAIVDSTGLYAKCDCDGSKYQLYDGQVVNGPATYALKQYQTSYNDLNNTLHVYN